MALQRRNASTLIRPSFAFSFSLTGGTSKTDLPLSFPLSIKTMKETQRQINTTNNIVIKPMWPCSPEESPMNSMKLPPSETALPITA